MKFLKQNEFYRLKIEELLLSIEQVKCLCPNHNLSTGLFAESILRCFLRTVLPQKVSVSQGFIEYNGRLSSQCDIIIYDRINYAPLYTFGDFEIIPNNAVISVIEVKTSINKKTFGKVLFDFERLYSMGIQNKYLFIFNGCNSKTLHSYFYGEYVPHYEKPLNDKRYHFGESLYNQDNYEYLPKAIISLSPNYYMRQDLCPTNNDWGYVTYYAVDNSNKKIACLQEFITQLLDLIAPPKDDDYLQQHASADEILSMNDALKDLFITDEFPMFHS